MTERTKLLTRSLDEIDSEVLVRQLRTGDSYARFKYLDYNVRTFAHVGKSKRFLKLGFVDIEPKKIWYRTCKRTKRLLKAEFAVEWARWRRRQRERERYWNEVSRQRRRDRMLASERKLIWGGYAEVVKRQPVSWIEEVCPSEGVGHERAASWIEEVCPCEEEYVRVWQGPARWV